MGKKSLVYRRRLRRLQQLKKRSRGNNVQPTTPAASPGEESQTDPILTGGSTPPTHSVDYSVTVEELEKKCLELRERLKRHSLYYEKKLTIKEEELNNVEAECEAECLKRIRQVRSFWVDKIYREGTRPGKMLKMAMQQRK